VVALIPRTLLFARSERSRPRLAPGGDRLAWLEGGDGVDRICVRTTGGRETVVGSLRGVRELWWRRDGSGLLCRFDPHGADASRLAAIALDGSGPRVLAGAGDAEARLVALSGRHPRAALITVNDRDPTRHDVYRLDLDTGRRTSVETGDVAPLRWIADHALRVRACIDPTADGGFRLLHRSSDRRGWRERLAWSAEDATTANVFGFADDDRTLFVASAAGRRTVAVLAVDMLGSGPGRVVAEDPDHDVDDVLREPGGHRVDAVVYERERREIVALDDGLRPDLRALRRACRGVPDVVARSRDDRVWAVADLRDDSPPAYSLWQRAQRRSRPLYADRPALADYQLAAMEPIAFDARDGLRLNGYLTLPRRPVASPPPAVVRVHGGPWQRDTWGFNAEVQWLADRGYACLQVNFRGSTGYGRQLLDAGDREWGGRMQDDLADAARHLVKQGLADPARIAVFGSSFGGFAALSALTREPELFACAVSLMGPMDLVRFVSAVPPAWTPLRALFHRRVGNPDVDAAMLRARSPRFALDRLRAPLLLAQGARDRRVPADIAREVVAALRAAGRDVEYLEFADEGHGFTDSANALRFYAAAEAFLARQLGGRCEPAAAGAGEAEGA
jgi:dipeptidyl aminopeptidase/acylaminoacyl peptidase